MFSQMLIDVNILLWYSYTNLGLTEHRLLFSAVHQTGHRHLSSREGCPERQMRPCETPCHDTSSSNSLFLQSEVSPHVALLLILSSEKQLQFIGYYSVYYSGLQLHPRKSSNVCTIAPIVGSTMKHIYYTRKLYFLLSSTCH